MANPQILKVKIHYYFSDASHQMDAVTRHKCEGEILKLMDQISYLLKIDPHPQTEAYREGGLKELWSFTKNNPYILAIFSGVLINVLSDQINIDREFINLQKDNLKLEIQQKKLNIYKLKKEIESGDPDVLGGISKDLLFILNNEYRVIRARSDFYRNLIKYRKVTSISGQQLDGNNLPLSDPKVVEREQFAAFILSTDDVPSEIDEEAFIEVISPVLKKGNYKWKGLYGGVSIDFYMKDKDFKESIFLKQVSFTNGISLKCVLEASRKMNEAGEVYISSYSVNTVISYDLGENLVKTTQGRQYLLNKINKPNQLNLFDKM